MLDKIISYSFYLLFFLTPLVWLPINFELFEFNKMIFVYLITVVITGTWLLKIIRSKSLILNQTPLDIPILLFLGANILSTIFSIDPHTSIWGYYSRSNGGLLSVVCYTLLYFTFVSNLDKGQALKILKAGLYGGLAVSLWAIPEHFGISPSCVILRGELSADCWVQDVSARVFATLGQPNWLAAYLGMLIFPALYFFLTSSAKKETIFYYLLFIIYYLAFTFTYSRGATLGFIAGFLIFMGLQILRLHPWGANSSFSKLKPQLIVLIGFLTINIIFGSALTRFHLTQFLPKSPQVPAQDSPQVSSLTQLEAGGTESGQIRLIVWKGALDIFKHYPIFGSGVETFAYSYYQFRPQAHNLVSEWDFLYNKAHNEFLNYLANTGLVGLGTYSIMMIIFIIAGYRLVILKRHAPEKLLLLALLASYISYLIQNIFGFSVVITALFFYLFPAIAFVVSDSTKPLRFLKVVSLIYHRPIYTKAIKVLIVFSSLYLLISILEFWYADTLFAMGEKANENGNAGKAYNDLSIAVVLNANQPFYQSELGFAAASAAVALFDIDATRSAGLRKEAVKKTDLVLQNHPKNVSFWRTAIRTYYQLVSLDDSFTQKTLDTIDQTIKLAPTDPKLFYNKAIILGQIDRSDEAINSLKKAIELKNNYREGYLALGLFYFDQKEFEQASEAMRKILQLVPKDPEALEHLNNWGKQGIATQSGQPT